MGFGGNVGWLVFLGRYLMVFALSRSIYRNTIVIGVLRELVGFRRWPA